MKGFIKLALLVGAIAVAGKLVAAKKAEWEGLTESEARAKVGARLPDRIPEEKREAVTEAVVGKMRERGVLRDDEQPPAGVDEGSEEATES